MSLKGFSRKKRERFERVCMDNQGTVLNLHNTPTWEEFLGRIKAGHIYLGTTEMVTILKNMEVLNNTDYTIEQSDAEFKKIIVFPGICWMCVAHRLGERCGLLHNNSATYVRQFRMCTVEGEDMGNINALLTKELY